MLKNSLEIKGVEITLGEEPTIKVESVVIRGEMPVSAFKAYLSMARDLLGRWLDVVCGAVAEYTRRHAGGDVPPAPTTD
jgi:hypothetical protein